MGNHREKRECFRYALIGGFWNGKDERRLARSRVSYVIALDMLLKVGRGGGGGETIMKLVVIGQVLTILFWSLQRLKVRDLLSYMDKP